LDVLAFLRFADKWEFESQKINAFEWLKKKGGPVERVVAGRLYNEVRRSFLIPAFIELVKRENPPSETEGALLGTRTLLCLMHCQHFINRYGISPTTENAYLNQYLESILIQEQIFP
jgi:hypothetical protein